MRRLLACGLALASLFAPILPPALAAETGSLDARIDGVIERLAPPECHVGISILALGSGKPLYERDANKLFTPASLQKLATASAALSLLGTQRRFLTRLAVDGLLEGGVLHGHLYLRGEGDPLLEPADLEELALHLRQAGVKRVAGDLVIDASYFQPEGRAPAGWAWDDLAQAYGAPVSALSLHRNAVDVTVSAGYRTGEPVKFDVSPGTGYVQVQSRAQTQASDTPAHLGLEVLPAPGGGWQELLVAHGGLPLGAATDVEHLSVQEPVHYVAIAMKEALARNGIAVDGQVRLGGMPSNAHTVATHQSPMLAEIVREMLKESDNMIAETMVLQLGAHTHGAPGTWEKGLQALSTFLERAGWSEGAYRLSDGSGLSRYDAVSPAMLARLLNYMPAQPVGYPALLIALPVAGIDGTLSKRLATPATRGRLRAKTGTMSGVSGLAGYLETADGHTWVVVIMTNGFVGPAARSRQLQDALIEALTDTASNAN